MNKKYYKKFSFGISLEISLEDYEKIIQDYLPYLSSIYFSLPYGDEFHTRERVVEEYKQENADKKLFEVLKLFQKNGIKLEAVINQYNIESNKIKDALNKLDKEIKINSICCLDEYYDIIDEHYNGNMYLVSSFNNEPLHKNNLKNKIKKLKRYNMLVLSKEFMRDINLMSIVKKEKFDVKLLINNGCSFNCLSCRAGGEKCREVFYNNLRRYSYEELYAIQSFFPWELHELFERIKNQELISEIKISNRLCTYEYLNNCLKSYIYNENEKKYIEMSYKNYHLWGRQANLIPYYLQFNLNRINEIKKNLWQKED